MADNQSEDHDHNSEECDCAHVLHLMPVGEDESNHLFETDCPCSPIVSPGFEEEGADEDDLEELREITIVRHNRRH